MSKDEEMTPNRVVGQQVQRLRLAREWSAETLAQHLARELEKEVPGYIARRLEKGERPITADEIAALAAIFGVSESALFGEDGDDADVYPVIARAATARSDYLDALSALRAAERDLEAVDLGGASPRSRREHRDRLLQVRSLLDGEHMPRNHGKFEDVFGGSDGPTS